MRIDIDRDGSKLIFLVKYVLQKYRKYIELYKKYRNMYYRKHPTSSWPPPPHVCP